MHERVTLSTRHRSLAASASIGARALELLGQGDHVRAVAVVEGLSDQRALEALARRRGRDLAAHGVKVVAMGGATMPGTS